MYPSWNAVTSQVSTACVHVLELSVLVIYFTYELSPKLHPVVDCGNLVNPSNGQVQFPQTTFGSVAEYTCSAGCEPVGDATRTCTALGVWSGSRPQCPGMCTLYIILYSMCTLYIILYIIHQCPGMCTLYIILYIIHQCPGMCTLYIMLYRNRSLGEGILALILCLIRLQLVIYDNLNSHVLC